MKILYITPFVQHPAMKTSFRHYYFLRDLARDNEITLLTPTKTPVPPEVMAELTSQTSRLLIFDAITRPRRKRHPLLRPIHEIGRKVSQYVQRRAVLGDMKRAFNELVRKGTYDLVLFHGRSVFPVIRGFSRLPLVVDFCDATSVRMRGRIRHAPLHRRPLHWIRYIRARRLDRSMVAASPHIAFISCRDRAAILGPESDAVIIPNAVDLEFWRRSVPLPDGSTLVFHGGMDYRPNVDAALYLIREVMPRINRQRRDAELLIVGRDPHPEILDAVDSTANVTVTGSVPDIRPYLERATVYTAPIRFGAGQQNKLLEAMAMEVPVVTSRVGEAGLRVGSDQPPVFVEDDVDAFVSRVQMLLESPERRTESGRASRAYIAANFSLEGCMASLRALCRAAVDEPTATPHSGLGRARGS